MRLAEEYDAAQDRGEVRQNGERGKAVSDGNSFFDGKSSASDIGIARKDIHEARQFRDAENAEPGLIKRALDSMVERGDEPTRAAAASSHTKGGRCWLCIGGGNPPPPHHHPNTAINASIL